VRILGIDQSLTGCAFCLLENAEIKVLETIDTEGLLGMERVGVIVRGFQRFLDLKSVQLYPDIIAMEDYAYGASTNNITKLAELGGIIKHNAFLAGFKESREAILAGKNAFHMQTQGAMKKFCLGNGAMKKDSRYLLEVFERIKKSFKDDNQADAYMHAWMASIVVAVVQGKVQISDLPTHQQEALISSGAKRQKGLSMLKAIKLPEEEKRRLAGY